MIRKKPNLYFSIFTFLILFFSINGFCDSSKKELNSPPTIAPQMNERGEMIAGDQALPAVHYPETEFEFDEVVDGSKVIHEFKVENRGKGPLVIEKVETGWGCTVASYTRQIPPGGEGHVQVKVDTSGYGGKRLKKRITIRTNDPNRKKYALTVYGMVTKFANITPRYARLNGQLGKVTKSIVTIIPEEDYPFTILTSKAKVGENIKHELKKNPSPGKTGWILTIENIAEKSGRYADMIIIETDNKIKPKIKIGVYGYIHDTKKGS